MMDTPRFELPRIRLCHRQFGAFELNVHPYIKLGLFTVRETAN